MKKNKNVELFFACDDNYIPMLAVVLESIRDNASADRFYNIRVLHTNTISEKNIKRVDDEYSRGNMDVEFVDITERVSKICEKLHTRDYYSKSTYYRLFIPNLYPELDKALYLDSDIVLLSDVAELYDIDLGDNFVGGIPDESVQAVPEFKAYVVNKIGHTSSKNYFNAGILPMNLKKLREIDFEDMFIDLLGEVTFDVAQDQDYLNTICKDHVCYIDAAWNKMPIMDSMDDDDIKLIHYNLSFKPWKQDGVLYGEKFWYFSDKCIYADEVRDIRSENGDYVKEIADTQTNTLKLNALLQAVDEDEVAETREKVNKVLSKYFV